MTDETREETIARRRKIFMGVFEGYPENAFDTIKLMDHRFISVEDDPRGEVWVKGHASLPAACQYLSDQATGGYKAEFVLDVETGERVELDVTAVVVPKTMGAVVVPLARAEAETIASTGEISPSIKKRITGLL
jgi:hypothetical protein